MTHRFPIIAFCLTASLMAASAAAQSPPSRCADCHFARPDAPGGRHVLDWDRSPHGRNNVGCETCHGGDPTTFESMLAHRDIVPFGAQDSPATSRNLPATCGVCHVGPFVAFQDSTHFLMLRNGDTNAPTCTTCHGDTAGRLLSARALASRCDSCHGLDSIAPRERRAARVRELYEELALAREELKQARAFVQRVTDPARREAFESAYQQAEIPLIQAVQAGHRFEYDGFMERLELGRQRTRALLEQLANPPGR
jgi:hypothetical protein